MADLATLKAQRSIIKGQLTRFQTFLDKSETQTPDLVQVETRLSRSEPLLKEFNDIQQQIEIIASSANYADEHENERSEFEEKYFDITCKAKRIIAALCESEAKVAPETEKITQAHTKNGQGQIRLPELDLPSFDGSYNNWLFFRDTFNSIVHNNKAMSTVNKFHYLRLSLKGEALDVISSLEISDANYELAWKLLLEQYENIPFLVGTHVKGLFNLPQVSKENYSELRSLINNATKHLRALQILGKPVEHWDLLIVHIIVNKLDSSTRREWEAKNTKNDSPTFDSLKQFLREKSRLLERLQSYSEQNITKQKIKTHVSTSTQSCVFCKENHFVYNCQKFLNLNTKERFNETKRLNICINCLRKNHITKDCTASTCRKCNKKHHTLLHFSGTDNSKTDNANISKPNSTNQVAQSNNQPLASVLSHQAKAQTLLSTAVVQAFDKNGKVHNCRVLLDSGSECSFITERLFNKLRLPEQQVNFTISGISQNLTSVSRRCEVNVQSKYNSFKTTLVCLILPNITENLPCFSFDRSSLNISNNIALADPDFDKPRTIDLLIGADVFWDLLKVGHIKLGKNKPSLQKTHLGWLVSGQVFPERVKPTITANLVTNTQLSKQVEIFWQLESVENKRVFTPQETACELHFVETHMRDNTGRFIVSLPFKQSPDEHLGSSKEQAQKRFYNLERKLQSDTSLKERYTRFLDEYEAINHMTKLSDDNESEGYYMPHHAVLREDKATTKLRVVFDASAPTSTGLSLNQLQMIGPVIQDDLVSIIMRFRKYAYVISADISKMYRQVLIAPDHRKYQKILWRSNPTDELCTYQLNTVTYGTTAASFLAVRYLKELAKECMSKLPHIAEIIEHDFYMDDLLSGADSVKEASAICIKVDEILKQACFELRKWRSNDSKVIETVSKGDELSPDIDFGAIETAKTLGLTWSRKSDNLGYKINLDISSRKVTKRVILSETAQIFDPLGLLGPCIINAKLIIQRLWQQQISWDESIPLDLNSAWLTFRNQLCHLNELAIARRVVCQNPKKVELHGFSDASESAYGACVYIRSIDKYGKINVHLLSSKTRVAPLKTTTIPRLELCAALLLAQLSTKVVESMNLKFDSIYHWTDSSIVLSWIKSPPNIWKIFVSNRISQILSLTEINTWGYVNTRCNPADLLSRGIEPKQIKSYTLWWNGPPWLSKEKAEWPKINLTSPCGESYPQEIRSEVKRSTTTLHLVANNFDFLTKFSSFSKLQRITAYCLRFKNNCLVSKNQKTIGTLTPKELKNALTCLVCLVQGSAFAKEISDLKNLGTVNKSSKILSLNPFLGTDGAIRVGGRLKHAQFDFQKRHPFILPKKHHLSRLIAEYEHKRLLHAGPLTVLASLRERFWILSGKNLVKSVTQRCVHCFRQNAGSIKYLMANLPKERITPARPFINCGLDYCGPFLIRDRSTRNYKQKKAYICLFICLATRAIHLELVGDLTTNAFLAALRRFVSRRGKCSNLYSDNATNFVGAKEELAKLVKAHKNEFLGELALEGISWHFIPPRAPHFGGIWEAGIKSVKSHLKRVLGNAILHFEEFYTVLTQIEACLNSRPLHPLSTDPNDPSVLTPSHFLIGEQITAIPEASYLEITENRLSRFQRLQRILQHFWKRWSREYLSELQVRNKWKQQFQELLQPGVLVLVKEDNMPPLKWSMGRVLQTHPGEDGVVRVVTIKTVQGVYKRPVAKLCILPCENV